jgi:hypothetical protein
MVSRKILLKEHSVAMELDIDNLRFNPGINSSVEDVRVYVIACGII